MTINFIEKLKAMKMTEFEFVNFEKKVSSPNAEGERMTYLVFDLKDPIPEVTSSNGIWDQDEQKRVHDMEYDVVQVQCDLELIEEYHEEFTFDEKDEELTKTGRYKGDMFLDLSSSGNVWLTNEKLSAKGVEWRKKKQKSKYSAIVQKTMERRKQMLGK